MKDSNFLKKYRVEIFVGLVTFLFFHIHRHYFSTHKIISIVRTPYSRMLYIGFFLFGLYEAFFKHDYMQAASFLGIGLAFDPFDVNQKWNERPIWQKAVLIVHLGLVAAMFGFGLGLNDK